MDYKNLFRKIERNLRTIERSNDLLATLAEILRRLVDDFQDDLGLVGGRIYDKKGSSYHLVREYPKPRAPKDYKIPATYPPIHELVEKGYVYSRLGDAGVDSRIEATLGVKRFAAIGIGEACRQIVAFTLRESSDPEQVGHTLNTIRHAINLKLRSEKFADRFAQARAIQLSLLPPPSPVFGDYDIFAASIPAEEVGGDLYDFIRVSDRSLGIAVADASGHGLPPLCRHAMRSSACAWGSKRTCVFQQPSRSSIAWSTAPLSPRSSSRSSTASSNPRERSCTATRATIHHFCGTAWPFESSLAEG